MREDAVACFIEEFRDGGYMQIEATVIDNADGVVRQVGVEDCPFHHMAGYCWIFPMAKRMFCQGAI
jgi:hypothetical protein